VDTNLQDDIPYHEFYYDFYADANHKLRVEPAEVRVTFVYA